MLGHSPARWRWHLMPTGGRIEATPAQASSQPDRWRSPTVSWERYRSSTWRPTCTSRISRLTCARRTRRAHAVHSRGRLSQPGARQPAAGDLRSGRRARRPGVRATATARVAVADSQRLPEAVGDPRQVGRQLRRTTPDEPRIPALRTTGSKRTRAQPTDAARESRRLHPPSTTARDWLHGCGRPRYAMTLKRGRRRPSLRGCSIRCGYRD